MTRQLGEKKTVVYYEDFEDLVKEVYGVKDFEFIPDVEANNGSYHTFNVSKIPKYSKIEDIKERIDGWQKGKKTWCMSGALFDDLCNREIIAEDEYLVYVEW